MRESMQVTIAMPAWATPSKPDELEGLGELRVGREQVVEVFSRRNTTSVPRSARSAVTPLVQHRGSITQG